MTKPKKPTTRSLKQLMLESQQPANFLRVHIRWMIRRDMEEVLQIERQAFEFPWFEEEFVRCLRQRSVIGMVAEAREEVVGFMIYELHKSRLHIMNFAVAADCRRLTVGRQLMTKLIGKLSFQRRTRISLEVRESNLAAQCFFRSAGFKATSVLRDFYDDSTEDAYLMQYCVPGDESDLVLPSNRIAGL